MTARVAVVTDSTVGLPTVLTPAALRVVPLPVRLGARSGFDGVDIGPDDVATALRNHETGSTSRPTPLAFERAYRAAFADGAQRVVSVHLSAELSGTWESARLAAQEFDYGAVRVVDSRSTAMGLGFAVLAAVRAADSGADASEVQDAAVRTVDRTSCFFYVDSLEYLRRGGRIGAAQAFVGTALSVKPLLYMRDGRVVPLEKVRTAAKAIARLLDVAIDAAGTEHVDVAVQHLASPERADEVSASLRERLPRLGELVTSAVPAAVGVHTGPGTVGVVVCRR